MVQPNNNRMKISFPNLALVLGLLAAAPLARAANDWPQWRGPDRNDVSKETGLLKAWPEGGPKRVWMFENAGQGYSGPAMAGGKLFTIGTRDNREVLLALDAATGKERWVAPLSGVLKNGWGDGPRGTPTVDGGMVYALSGEGSLVCVQVADGKKVWEKTMSSFGGKKPGWGFTESPLVDGGKVLCTPGGAKGAIVALDKKTGNVLWQSAEFTDGAQYASIIAADVKGVRQYIQLTMQSIVGLDATDGKVLWKSPFPGQTAVIPTPIYRDGQVYVTAGYSVGCKSLKIVGGAEPETLYENKVMKNHHGGAILVGDYVYGHSDGGGWVCQNFKTGEEVWSEKKLGKGAIACADGMLYCLDESKGTVALIEASPDGWKEHGRFTLSPQTKIRNPEGRIWTHPVISNGKLYLRDQDLIYCFDVKKG